ncbi:MAG TPA: hypothetical protein VHY22_00420 [Chthoniobacteraceae bacterium]|jgi:hypothetical protein|nr:hypothetical protein [Chthoniobacteraceae bacterium]
MNLLKSILSGYARHGLTAAAGFLLAHGIIQQADQQIIISAGLALAGVAWSTVSKFLQNYELKKANVSSPRKAVSP